ncbi:MAG: glucodextranase DOMON-like domain-containing protein [Desulfurococcaceae archaeon]
MYLRNVLAILMLLTIIVSSSALIRQTSGQQEKIYVAFIWHYHQPWYYSIDETYFELPWVRMHSVGNYYKMAYILSKYPNIRVTFTFSGSLLEQIIDIIENRKKDVRWIISEKIINGTVTEEDVFNMLRIPGGFFDINWARIVDKSIRYRELRDLAQNAFRTCSGIARSEEEFIKCVVNMFTGGNLLHQRVIDLAVMFNLLWIDPQVIRELYPDLNNLRDRAFNNPNPSFTTDDLHRILNVHYDIISRIPNIYRELANRGQIELIPVPYSHPLAPIITALGFKEDLEIHVEKSIDLFKQYFNYIPKGVWPAEQAINEFVAEVFRNTGFNWTVTDETILAKIGVNTDDINNIGIPWTIDFQNGRMYIFFREMELSNKISFQYGFWRYTDAVSDLVNTILNYRQRATGPRLIVIALDGENPWEHYEEFGTLFLNELYRRLSELQDQNYIETITPGEFITKFSDTAKSLPLKQYYYLDLVDRDISNIPPDSYGDGYSDLPRKEINARLPEGSWSGGELAIWIGHRQENVATMWLVKARSDILRKLGLNSFRELYQKHPDVAKYLLKAEASDWWWWYGGDGGGSPAPFDPLFKSYLRKAYELAGLTPPDYLNVYAYPDGTPIGVINDNVPIPVETPPLIDGVIEDIWLIEANAGRGLKIPVGNIVQTTYLLIDNDNIYLAFNVSKQSGLSIGVYFNNPAVSLSPYKPEYNVYPRYSRVDLGIYLAREILVDIDGNNVYISKALGDGSWSVKNVKTLFIREKNNMYNIELTIPFSELDLIQGAIINLAVVTYVENQVVEYSSRLGLAYQIQVPRGALIGRIVFEMNDPEGDDDGPGGVKYPKNPVFTKGVFDLLKFRVIETETSVVFITQFANLGGNPWNGPNGWSLQQVHIYIHTSIEEPGLTDMIALNAKIIDEHAWHMAILLAPGWGTEPIPQGEKSGLYYYNRNNPEVQNGKFRVYADHASNSIIAEISKELLLDVENIDKWIYVVAVYSHDGYGHNRIRSVVVGEPEEWKIGVPAEYGPAVLNNVFPFILDLLAPTAEEQYSMLRSFDPEQQRLASVRGYGPSLPTTTETTPATETITTPVSGTETETPTETLSETTVSEVEREEKRAEQWIPIMIIIIVIIAITIIVYKLRRKS